MRRAKNGIASFKREARHLFKRQYPVSSGDWSTLYYGIFKDWKGVLRKFPLGSKLKPAQEQLAILEADNVKKKDFDLEKIELAKAKTQGMTLAEWLDRYLDLTKHTPSGETRHAQCAHLIRLMGSLPLSQINRVRIMEYKQRRLSEPLMRHRGPVKGTRIMGSTVNREVSCLVTALNLAADEGLCDGAPRIKKEREISRDRILTDDEYKALLDASPQWLQRVMIAANEAALDRGVLINLTWDSIRDGLIKVKGGRDKTGVTQRVGISPALKEILDELRTEYLQIPIKDRMNVLNTERRVFTKDGKRIHASTLRHAFESARDNTEIKDFQLRDFRHCARTRWAAAGLPFEVAEIGIGHQIRGMAGRYTNLTDDQILYAFQEMFTRSSHRESELATANGKSF